MIIIYIHGQRQRRKNYWSAENACNISRLIIHFWTIDGHFVIPHACYKSIRAHRQSWPLPWYRIHNGRMASAVAMSCDSYHVWCRNSPDQNIKFMFNGNESIRVPWILFFFLLTECGHGRNMLWSAFMTNASTNIDPIAPFIYLQ